MIGPWETRQLLFAYGSLLLPTGLSEVDEAMAGAIDLGRAQVSGRLYHLGDYPGLVPPEAGEAYPPKVKGRLFAFPHPGPALAALDRYEGFDPRLPLAGEFIRREAEVFPGDREGSTTAQVYYYNAGIQGRPLIDSGDYLHFKQAKDPRS